tara:strand:- start:37865 stop:38377 length:513 start_codon:yes stop_codon:yes gene_type:complete
MKKLNLGCGNDIRKGYINIDREKLDGVDVVHDLNKFPYPFKKNYFDEILSLGTIELLDDFLKVVEELHRICKNGGIIKIRSPAFPNMCSAQDPLTKKFMTYNTFEYFKDGGFDYYSKARFKTLKREYIFSLNPKLKWLSFLPNLAPKFYTRFLFNLFPSNCLYYKLKVIK